MGKKNRGKQPKKKGGGCGYADLDGVRGAGEVCSNSGRPKKGGKNQGNLGPGGKQRRKKPKGGKGTQTFDDDNFRRTLLADGKKSIIEMMSDGNCLFRSLSDQLYGDYGNRHDQIRKEVCDFLQQNEQDFAVFLLLDDDEEDVCDFDEYIRKMSEDGEWGGNVELVSAARLYRRTITVFSVTGAFSIESGHDEVSGDNLLLSYHDNGHYNSVKPTQAPPRRETRKNSKASSTGKSEEMQKADDNAQSDSGGGETAEKKTAIGSEDGQESTPTEKQKPLRKNDPCPCGSGLRYKKCCLAAEKSQARVAKWKEMHGGDSETSPEPAEDVALEGDLFRVLKI